MKLHYLKAASTTLNLSGMEAGNYPLAVENEPGKRSPNTTFRVVLRPPEPRIRRYSLSPGGTPQIDKVYNYLRLYASGLLEDTKLLINKKPYKGKVTITITSGGSTGGSGYVQLPDFSTKGWSAGGQKFVLENRRSGLVAQSRAYTISFADPHIPSISYLRFYGSYSSSTGYTEKDYKYLQIRGKNFAERVHLYLDGKRYSGKIRRLSSTTLQLEPYSTRGQKEGSHTCQVYNLVKGKTHKSNTYNYNLRDGRTPQISSVRTSNGSLYTERTYTFLRISGRNFASDAKVLFDGVPYSKPVHVDQDNQIYLYQFKTTGFQPGQHTLVVRNTFGGKKFDSRVYSFTISDGQTPRIRSVSFSPSGRIYPGEVYQVRLSVDNVMSGASLLLDGRVYSGSVQISQKLFMVPQFDTTGLTLGRHYFQVRNQSGGKSADSNSYGFTISKRYPPRLTSLSPSWINNKTPTRVQVRGSYFLSSSKVHLDGNAVNTTYQSSSLLYFTLDPQKVKQGRHEVKVVNNDGQQSPALPLHLVPDLSPLLVRIYPNELHLSADTKVSQTLRLQLYGFNLVSGSSVIYKGKQIGTVTASSSTASYVSAYLPANVFTQNGEAKLQLKSPQGKVSNSSEVWIYGRGKPDIYQVNPRTLSTTSSRATITVYGRGFSPKSSLLLNKTKVAAQYIPQSTPSSYYGERLQATLDSTLLSSLSNPIEIVVENPDGSKSPPYTIVSTSSSLSLTSMRPTVHIAGNQQMINAYIRGKGFTRTTSLYLDGQQMPTRYSSSYRLYATLVLPASLKPGSYHRWQLRDGSQVSNMYPLYLKRGPLITTVSTPLLSLSAGPQRFSINTSGYLAGATLELFGRSYPLFLSSRFEVVLQQELSQIKPGMYTFYIKYPSGDYSNTSAVHVTP